MSWQLLPQEMTDAIMDHLEDNCDLLSLDACSMVCKAWTVPARRHLCKFVCLYSEDIARFLRFGQAIFPC
jgi:hypothetical protein